MNDGRKIEVLARGEGVELVQHLDGACELRPTGQAFESMDAAFDAIAVIRR
ncbi:MAG: hypothetical protein H0V17_12650 [Deltaproteobacteria bacterium]|nr:hypothetical protein [Deltaproteobacteria bacterium]